MNNFNINDVYAKYILESKARVVVLYGGADSGKSYFVGGQYIPLSMLREKYFRGMVVRKVATTLRNSVFTEITDGLDNLSSSIRSSFQVNNGNLQISFGPNGNKCIFVGLDKIPKLKSIKGINFIWVEEAEEIGLNEYNNLLLRLRGGGYERLFLSYNPVDDEYFGRDLFDHKIGKVLEYNEWGDPKVWTITVSDTIDDEYIEYEVLVVKTTYKDNHFISPMRKLAIESLKDTNPELYEIMARGNYVSLGERIFNNWEVVRYTDDPKIEAGTPGYLTKQERDSFDKIRHGIDWGFYPDPFRYLKVNIDSKRKIIDIIHEESLLEATNQVSIEAVKPNLEYSYYPIKADSSEPKSIRDYKTAGIRIVPAKKGPGSVDYGIKKLQEYKIRINAECVETIKDFKGYKRKKDKDGNIMSDPIDAFNHSPDVVRYIMEDFTDMPSAVNVRGL